jgi:hypothetical protein
MYDQLCHVYVSVDLRIFLPCLCSSTLDSALSTWSSVVRDFHDQLLDHQPCY